MIKTILFFSILASTPVFANAQNTTVGTVKNDNVEGNKTVNDSRKTITTNSTTQKNVNNGTNNGIVGDNGTIINNEVVHHPDRNLLNQINDSAKSKSSLIYIKYENTQRTKNSAFCTELITLLHKEGYTNIKLDDSIYQWGITGNHVLVSRSGDNVMLFVTMY